MKSRWFLPGAALIVAVTIALGTAGFREYSLANSRGWSLEDSLFLSVQLFALNSQAEAVGYLPLALRVARWSATLVVFSTVLLVALGPLRRRLTRFRLGRLRGHTVIGGLGWKGMALALDHLARKGHGPVVAIDTDPAAGDQRDFTRRTSAIFLPGTIADSTVLGLAGASRARRIYLVSGDDTANVEACLRLRDLPRDAGAEIYVHLDLPGFADQQSEAGEHFFSTARSGARGLLLEQPAFSQDEEGRLTQIPIAIVGRTTLAEELIFALAETWARHQTVHPAGNRGALEIILAGEGTPAWGDYLRWKHRTIREYAKLICFDAALDSLEFARGDFLRERAGFCIYVCLEEEIPAVRVGQDLCRLSECAGSGRVVIASPRESGVRELVQLPAAGRRKVTLEAFGLLDRVCTRELIIGGTHDLLASKIHDYWDEKFCPNARTPWAAATDRQMADSRAAADVVSPMLYSAGLVLRREHSTFTAPCLADFGPDLVEQLAGREHRRWLNEKLNTGWTYGPVKDELAKKNPMLLPWKDPRLSDEARQKNRDFIQHLPALLALAGFIIEPRPNS